MQVSCGHCGAKYEFDSAAVPPGGYDAQCTTCGNVFFVMPEGLPDPSQIVTATCTNCHAVYQFAASAVPPGGYQAQCTQCQAVFFVGPSGHSSGDGFAAPGAGVGMATPAQSEVSQAAYDVAALPASQSTPGTVAVVESLPAQPPPELPLEGLLLDNEATTPDSQGSAVSAADGSTSAGAMLSEQTATPTMLDSAPSAEASAELESSSDDAQSARTTGSDAAVEFQAMLSKKRRRLIIAIGAAVAVTVIAVVVMPMLLKHFKSADPEVIELVKKAREQLFEDIDSSQVGAQEQAQRALNLDAEDPDALATKAMAHIFRGADLRLRGRQDFDRAVALQAEMKGLEGAVPPPADAATRIAALKPQAAEFMASSLRDFETAGAEMAAALGLLRGAEAGPRSSALLAEVAGLYYSMDADTAPRAQEELQKSLELLSGVGAKLDLTKPPDALCAYLQARVWLMSKPDRARAPEALRAALAFEPNNQRFRFELAQELAASGDNAQAKEMLAAIASAVPKHEKAAQLTADIAASERKAAEAAAATAAATATVAQPAESTAVEKSKPPAKGKRRKAKRKG